MLLTRCHKYKLISPIRKMRDDNYEKDRSDYQAYET